MQLPASLLVLERGWLSSNNIVCFDGDTATLVDAGYVGHAAQTVDLVKSALATRRRSTPLARLINTHSHSDHIGGNAAVQQAFGCEIVIPSGIEDMVRDWDEHALLLSPANQRAERFAHDAVIAPQQEFDMGGLLWRALPAPGHDMAALVFYCAEERLLISGDALWQDGFGIIFADLMEDASGEGLRTTRQTLEMIGRLDVATVIPGHGSPFADVDAALERAFSRLAAFEKDGSRMARNALRACFTFSLLDLQRLKEDELPAYLAGVPFFASVNERMLRLAPDELAQWLLSDLTRSGAVDVKDGWILPAMAP